MDQRTFDRLRLELSVNAKNGVDFIVSATVVWLVLAWIWTRPYSDYNRSILTFIAGSMTIPLAFALSATRTLDGAAKDCAAPSSRCY